MPLPTSSPLPALPTASNDLQTGATEALANLTTRSNGIGVSPVVFFFGSILLSIVLISICRRGACATKKASSGPPTLTKEISRELHEYDWGMPAHETASTMPPPLTTNNSSHEEVLGAKMIAALESDSKEPLPVKQVIRLQEGHVPLSAITVVKEEEEELGGGLAPPPPSYYSAAPLTPTAALPPPLMKHASSLHTSYTVRGSVMQYEAEHPTQGSSKRSSQLQPSLRSSSANVEIKMGQHGDAVGDAWVEQTGDHWYDKGHHEATVTRI